MYDDTLPIRIIGIVMGVIFIIFGLLVAVSPSFVSRMIKFGNSMQGVKTKITSTTLATAKISGIIGMIAGIGIIIFALVAK